MYEPRKTHRVVGPSLQEYWRKLNVQEPGEPIQDLVSVITVVRNGISTLSQTIKSVEIQDYPLIEYIIVDGCSTDGTQDIIIEAGITVSRWISEPDEGISDAFNKGIALARGQFVALLNADDRFSPQHIRYAVQSLKASDADFVFGDITLYREDRAVSRITGDSDYQKSIHKIMPAINHPTVVARRSTYEKFGLFRLDLRTAMDYEWFLRLHKGGGRGIYNPQIMCHMCLAGESDRQQIRGLREVRVASIAHGYPSSLAWLLFMFRIIKSRARLITEFLLPVYFSNKIRQYINRNYKGIH